MGKIMQGARLRNAGDIYRAESGDIPVDQIREINPLELLVDTGAAMLCLPVDVIECLGLRPLHQRNVITANGEVQRRVYSPARVNIMDREANLDVMELPLGTPPLLGYLPLEALDLYPNPQACKLEGNPKYDGKMVMDLL